MDGTLKKYGKSHIVCTKFSRRSKNSILARILESMKKRKLLNKEDYMLFIDSTSIKVTPDINKNRYHQEHSIGRLKRG